MIDFFRKLFDTSDFPERWYCGNWETGHGWLHIISDTLIFGAYTAIPITLLVYAWKKQREILFEKLMLLFAAFILACGLGHLIEATIFWHPWYRLSGAVKAFTAIVSWMTFFAVAKNLPTALKLPGMVTVNRHLEEALQKQKTISAELERSNEDLDQFAYVACHDLKAPLRSIRNLAGWVQEDCETILPPESKRHLEQLQSRVDRLESLLNDLLSYSRAGRDLEQQELVMMEPVVNQIFDDFRPSAEHIEFEIRGSLPSVTTWEVLLSQVLRNLIGNAVKHHDKPNGHVWVKGRNFGKEMAISVSDDGPGIEPRYHKRIFGMFQTLRPKDEVEGSGMGLAIVDKLVQRIGGRIELESEVGVGTTFTVFIPVPEEVSYSSFDGFHALVSAVDRR